MKQPPHPVHWNYQHHPGRRRVLREESTRILLELRQKTIDAADLIADTREAHRRLFSRLVPRSCPNFAGHYRGENFPYLKFCSVGIIGNPFVGCPPQLVSLELQKFDQIAQSAIKRLDGVFASPNATMSSASKLLALVQVVARLFGHFLAIHPYADGNGHVGRLLVIALLGRYDFWPSRFSLEPRPPGIEYSSCIQQWQFGNPAPLEFLLLQYIKG